MRKYGLIGFPLGHSFSQKYFNEKFERENISDCSYENFPMQSVDSIPDLIRETPELCGLNVTIPHKTNILKYIDIKSTDVLEIGAANVLKIKRIAGKTQVFGFNSDVTGISDSIFPFLSVKVKNVLILGTGGSSKAVAYTMKNLGLQVTCVSRKRTPGLINYRDLTASVMENMDIIVNTTPLGMYPDISSKPEIDYDLLNKNHILFDLVYNPGMTTFLKMGKERGCRIVTGLKMLYSQAEKSWEIWNDKNL